MHQERATAVRRKLTLPLAPQSQPMNALEMTIVPRTKQKTCYNLPAMEMYV